MLSVYRPVQAHILIKQNVSALLRIRHKKAKDLAQYCHRSESWISKILSEPRRQFPYKYLDRMADFLGVSTYQLLQPGFTQESERRSGFDRRRAKERRINDALRGMLPTAELIESLRPLRKGASVVVASSPIELALKRLTADYEKHVAALLQAAAHAGQQTPTPGSKIPPSRKGHRVAGGSHVGKS